MTKWHSNWVLVGAHSGPKATRVIHCCLLWVWPAVVMIIVVWNETFASLNSSYDGGRVLSVNGENVNCCTIPSGSSLGWFPKTQSLPLGTRVLATSLQFELVFSLLSHYRTFSPRSLSVYLSLVKLIFTSHRSLFGQADRRKKLLFPGTLQWAICFARVQAHCQRRYKWIPVNSNSVAHHYRQLACS